MKKLCLFLGIITIIGCTTTQQKATFNTLYSLENTTTGVYDGYIALVAKGSVPTNGVPSVSKAFNDFQASMQVAVILAQNNINAIAPSNLVAEATSISTLITQLEGGH